jgi:hypothetical protein
MASRQTGSMKVMETTLSAAGTRRGRHDQRSFLLQRAQPAMAGVISAALGTAN